MKSLITSITPEAKSMRILIIHNQYQQAGGEDTVVRNESCLLQDESVEVITDILSNARIKGPISKAFAAIGSVFSVPAFVRVLVLLRKHRPDVVHVHNFFPLLSPSVFYACKIARVPVVVTLHNYRILCPTAILMHRGRVVEKSLSDGPWWAVRERVYRDSLIGSFWLALSIWLHWRLGTWRFTVSKFFVLTEFARATFLRAGIPSSKLILKPNFTADQGETMRLDSGRFLFVGRLSAEKGIEVLRSAAASLADDDGIQIDVIGTGPCSLVGSPPQLKELGHMTPAEVRTAMLSARALIIPSTWFEGFPMVLVEAYSCGLPVIASRIGALEELVEDGGTGLLFEMGNATDLADKITWASKHPAEMAVMGRHARRRYETRYSDRTTARILLDTYTKLSEGLT